MYATKCLMFYVWKFPGIPRPRPVVKCCQLTCKKSMELRKQPIYVISILVILWYILSARTQYYIENMMVVKPSMHLTLVVYVYFTKHLHHWLASQPAPTLVCRVCCRTSLLRKKLLVAAPHIAHTPSWNAINCNSFFPDIVIII